MICPNIPRQSSGRDASITRDIEVQTMRNARTKDILLRGCIIRDATKHHYEYWIDYSLGPVKGMAGMKMPLKYVNEMIMDRIAASKIYEGKVIRSIRRWNIMKRVRILI